MVVVSDTSPILNLAATGHLGILQGLYTTVVVPDAVIRELLAIGPEAFDGVKLQSLPWVEVRTLGSRTLVESLLLELDVGEAEAIALALESKADLLLVDERRARQVASRLGLKYVGLIGALIHAKRTGLIAAVKPVLDDLRLKAGFWVSERLYVSVLREAEE